MEVSSPATRIAEIADAIQRQIAVVLTVAFVPDAWIAAAKSGFVHAKSGTASNGDFHAVLAVGVDINHFIEPAVIVKNSWGNTWGDGGYGYLTETYLLDHLAATHYLETL